MQFNTEFNLTVCKSKINILILHFTFYFLTMEIARLYNTVESSQK